MIRLLARSHRKALLIWPVALALTCLLSAASIADFYTDPADRLGYAAAFELAPVLASLSGSGTGLDSLGGIIANELAVILFSGIALAAILVSTAMTRGNEDLGRTELLTAKPIRRTSPFWAAVLLVIVVLTALTGLALASLLFYDVPLIGPEAGTTTAQTGGALTYSASVFAYALVFVGLGFLAGELVHDTKGARSLTVAVFFVCYAVRIITVATASGTWWASPLGWFDHVEPFAETRLWPLALSSGVGVVLLAAAFLIRRTRDLNSGLIGVRRGKTRGSALLGTPVGILMRLSQSTLIIWTTLGLVLGVMFGCLLPEWIEIMELNLESMEAFGFTASADSISQVAGLMASLFGAAAGINVVGTVAGEESATRLSYLLARPLSRCRLWFLGIGLALIVAVVVTGLTVGSYVVAAIIADAELDAGRSLTLMATYLVPALLLTAIAAAGLGLRPGGHRVAWLVFAFTAVMVLSGEMLQAPQWLLDVSPLNSLGLVPVEDPDLVAVAAQLALTAAALVVAGWGFLRREMQ